MNLARELMGHKPVDVEPQNSETLSRPAELVQRARQLAQLTNFQFGRGTIVQSSAFNPSAIATATVDTAPRSTEMFATRSESGISPIQSLVVKTTAQKLEEFYGVKQEGDETVFAARFENARKVLIAGDFNNWLPMSTPMQTIGVPGRCVQRCRCPQVATAIALSLTASG